MFRKAIPIQSVYSKNQMRVEGGIKSETYTRCLIRTVVKNINAC